VTENNKRENIREELSRAAEAIDAASLLFDKGFFKDAVSRLYYFLLYNIRALLLTKGFEPRSHEGALRILGLHFIKEGIFEPGFSHIFSKLMKYREEADYNPSYVFTKEDFIELRKEAEDVSKKTKVYLKSKGYL
jgi:uncharacterized protein (UPF0332 family)